MSELTLGRTCSQSYQWGSHEDDIHKYLSNRCLYTSISQYWCLRPTNLALAYQLIAFSTFNARPTNATKTTFRDIQCSHDQIRYSTMLPWCLRRHLLRVFPRHPRRSLPQWWSFAAYTLTTYAANPNGGTMATYDIISSTNVSWSTMTRVIL